MVGFTREMRSQSLIIVVVIFLAKSEPKIIVQVSFLTYYLTNTSSNKYVIYISYFEKLHI